MNTTSLHIQIEPSVKQQAQTTAGGGGKATGAVGARPNTEIYMSITKKEKELASVGISIAAGCKPCTDYHVKAVREAGASDDEIGRAIEDAVAVRNAATSIMSHYGHSHFGDAEHEEAAAIPRDRLAAR